MNKNKMKEMYQGTNKEQMMSAYKGAMKSGKLGKGFGGEAPMEPKKMTPEQVASRHRTMLSNAARKVFGGR